MRRDKLLSKKDPALGDLENSLPIQTDSVLWRQGQGCGWTIICLTHGYNQPLQKLEIDMGIYTWLPRKNQNRDMVIYTWLPRKDLQRTLLSNGLGPMNYMRDWQGFWEFHTSRSASSLDWKGERRKQNKGRITPRAADDWWLNHWDPLELKGWGCPSRPEDRASTQDYPKPCN